MAQFLLKIGDQSPYPGHAKDGDVIYVGDDNHIWGRCESLEVWTAEGNDPAAWPGGFFIVKVPGLPFAEAQDFAARPLNYVLGGPERAKSFNYRGAIPANKLAAGVITITPTQARTFIAAKVAS